LTDCCNILECNSVSTASKLKKKKNPSPHIHCDWGAIDFLQIIHCNEIWRIWIIQLL